MFLKMFKHLQSRNSLNSRFTSRSYPNNKNGTLILLIMGNISVYGREGDKMFLTMGPSIQSIDEIFIDIFRCFLSVIDANPGWERKYFSLGVNDGSII